jgi:hypothetical protein
VDGSSRVDLFAAFGQLNPAAPGSAHPSLADLKQFRVADYIFDPKLPHHPPHVIGPEATPIWMFVAELTHARDPRIWVTRVWRKGRISWLMNDALRSNIELVAPDQNVLHDLLFGRRSVIRSCITAEV